MRILSLVLVVFLLSGCSLVCRINPDWCDEKPTPKPTVTPIPLSKGIPSIVTVGDHKELRIDNQKVAAVGRYEIFIDPSISKARQPEVLQEYAPISILNDIQGFPDNQSVKNELLMLKSNGVNMVRIWIVAHFKPSDLSPWKIVNGKYELSQLDPAFLSRMDMIGGIADEIGICIAWTIFDGWSLRARAVDWSVNPDNHTDTRQPKQWDRINYFCQSQFPLSRSMWNCKIRDNVEGFPCQFGLDGRNSPVQWELVQTVATIAKNHNDIIYLWSEMFPDADHKTWDITAMRSWTAEAVERIRTYYSNCIIGTSVDRWQMPVYELVDIADCHGLTRINPTLKECDTSLIGSAISVLRDSYPNVVFCANSDGCMSAPRFTKEWVATVLSNAWNSGGFAEFKMDSVNQTGIFEGIKSVAQ